MGYIENAEIEVVSDTNVLISFENQNDSILFNNNLELIEIKYNSIFKTNYKFVALSKFEWEKEKNKFINNKNKKYNYIVENEIISEQKKEIENIAEDIFGSDIIEIR